MKQTIKNHVAILLDTSSSMRNLMSDVVKVFNNQIDFLRRSSLSYEQETRVSVYQFDDTARCVISDVDVARPTKLETLQSRGMTALFDCVKLAVDDLKQLPQTYGDHSFIIYILTDGEENYSNITHSGFQAMIKNLPDNFTIVAFVPNMNGKVQLKRFGIPEGNIDKWDVTANGVEEVGRKFEKTMTNFYTGRSTGVRGFNSVFENMNKVKESDIKAVANQVTKYKVVQNTDKDAVEIRPLVEKKIKTKYKIGSAFYELVKNEHIQATKEIAVINKKNGKVFAGKEARAILALPDYEIKVTPKFNDSWDIFVQSTSVNRKVIPNQRVLVIQ